MGISSAMNTGLSGLSANQSQLDVVGNNIANSNTIGYKASRLDFKSQFYQTFSYGSAPGAELGGTNPLQVGLGVVPGAVSRNFSDGSREVTGVNSNLAIEGDGFFVVKDGGGQFYTRDGSFKLNNLNELVNSDGLHVQGYGVDDDFNVVPGVLQNITIPLGSLTIAQATDKVSLNGILNTDGLAPTKVSDSLLNQDFFVSDGAGGVTGTAPTATTDLSLLADSGGNLLFPATAVLNMSGKVGGKTSPTKTLAVTPATGPASTLGDLLSFMTGSLGINTATGANGAIATTPGASIVAGPTGAVKIDVAGNLGEDNSVALDQSSLTVTNAGTTTTPFTWANIAGDGESVTTSTSVYDSLGTGVKANMTVSLLSKTSTGTTWQFYATSPDGSGTGAAAQNAIATGILTFDTGGKLVSATPATATIDRSNTGADPNLTYALDFSGLSALGKGKTVDSTLSESPNGLQTGTLTKYSIDGTGFINGTFTNGDSRVLGQIALATFKNNQGLVDKGSNMFTEGPNSGTAVISAPGEFTAGHLIPNSLELANVDLSSEFVKLISASTGFSSSSKIITTSNQLLQELLSAVR